MPSESKGLYHVATGLTRLTRTHASNPHARVKVVFVAPPVQRVVVTQSGHFGAWKMKHAVLR